jgi:hypothetical protein
MASDLPPCGQYGTWPYIGRMKGPKVRSRVVSSDASEPTTCTDGGGQGRDRTADLPLFRRWCGLHQCVSAGQTGRATGIRTCWISRSGSSAPYWPHEMTQSVWQADRVTWSVEPDLGEVLVCSFRLPKVSVIADPPEGSPLLGRRDHDWKLATCRADHTTVANSALSIAAPSDVIDAL